MRSLGLGFLLALTWLTACDGKDEIVETGISQSDTGDRPGDSDGDGYTADEDCDDSEASVNPGQDEEPYDGLDNDCDETTPDDDLDEDGYGIDEDCDDEDASINPGAIESCNGVDDDCNGEVDDSITQLWYADEDGDGYGDPDVSFESCEQSGYVADNSDCDDSQEGVNPAADEVCDEQDNDCDGDVDEDDATDASTWYTDEDGDGFGGADSAHSSCEAPDGYQSDGSDCDDTDATIHPDADEVCDEQDNDCDGDVDEDDATDASTWYIDFDGDGYGSADFSTAACDATTGYEANADDCDDSDVAIHPDADEVCDEQDNDCDGEVDEDDATDVSTWYKDNDGDGYGNESRTTESCDQPSGYVDDDSDCDDRDNDIYPGAEEVCDDEDNDCDDDVDEDATDADTWYVDGDEDGFGYEDDTVESCDQPSGYVDDAADCDDGDDDIHPDAEEVCDGEDNDCDGEVDNDITAGTTTWYADEDGDGYGDAEASEELCEEESGYVDNSDDCDDTRADVYPDAADSWYDGIDMDCDGASDYDIDGDGYDSDEYGGDDCNDYLDEVYPGADETWYDGLDGDCAGDGDYDADGDGYDSDAYSGDDCDDTDPEVNPGATEVDEGIDQDCDGDAESIPLAIADVDSRSSLDHCQYIYLTSTGSYDPDGGDIVGYEWELDSAPSSSVTTTSDIEEASDEDPIFFADVPGTYVFSLSVTDDGDTVSEPDSVSITVGVRGSNTAPEADAGDDQVEETDIACTPISYGVSYSCPDCDDVEITLDGTESDDDDDEQLTYTWSVVSGSASLDDDTSATPTVTVTDLTATYGSVTTHTVEMELTVTDCYGATSPGDSVVLEVDCTGM